MALTKKTLTHDSGGTDSGLGKDKKDLPPTKIIVRRLPPSLTAEMFLDQISPIPEHDYFCYFKADMSLGVNAFSRAYINLVHQEDLWVFTEKFDGYVFLDSKGNEYPAMVEFAPFQKVPKKKSRKADGRKNTIEQDPDYVTFLDQLEHPDHGPLPTIESVLEEIETRDRERKDKSSSRVTTPLIEYIRKRREEKRALILKAKDDKRKRELDRKKLRDDERRKREHRSAELRHDRSKSESDKEKSVDRELHSRERQNSSSDRHHCPQHKPHPQQDKPHPPHDKPHPQQDTHKESPHDKQLAKDDITVRVLRNPEREKQQKHRETSKSAGKDHGYKSHDDRDYHGSKAKDGYHGNKHDHYHGNKRDGKEYHGRAREVAGVKDHNNGSHANKDVRKTSREEGAPKSGARRQEVREKSAPPERESVSEARTQRESSLPKDRRPEANKSRPGSSRKETPRHRDFDRDKDRRDAKSRNDNKSERPDTKRHSQPGSVDAENPVKEADKSSVAESGNKLQPPKERKETPTDVSEPSEGREGRRRGNDADDASVRRTRNKDRPEREIYVPGARKRGGEPEKKPSNGKSDDSATT